MVAVPVKAVYPRGPLAEQKEINIDDLDFKPVRGTDELPKGERKAYRLSDAEIKELNRKLEKGAPQRGAAGALDTGWVPSFYNMGQGYFADTYGGKRPMHIEEGLAQFYAGDLLDVDYGSGRAFFAPYDENFDSYYKAAYKNMKTHQMAAKIASRVGGYGKPFGLKPFQKRRRTPFTIDREGRDMLLENISKSKNVREGEDISS